MIATIVTARVDSSWITIISFSCLQLKQARQMNFIGKDAIWNVISFEMFDTIHKVSGLKIPSTVQTFLSFFHNFCFCYYGYLTVRTVPNIPKQSVINNGLLLYYCKQLISIFGKKWQVIEFPWDLFHNLYFSPQSFNL